MKIICFNCGKPGDHWRRDWYVCDYELEEELREMIYGSD